MCLIIQKPQVEPGDIVSFKTDSYYEEDSKERVGTVVYIHPKHYFIILEIAFSNGARYRECINRHNYRHIKILPRE